MAFFQTENLWVNRLADGVADLVLDMAESPINALTPAALADLDAALNRVDADANFGVLLLRTAKSASFCAGLALQVLADMTPAEFAAVSDLGQQLCQKLEDLRLPSVAIVAGACMGGGLELALACDYRVAVKKPTTLFGFPELELGLIPIWGGTQRLPRRVGLERSLQMLLGGKRLGPHDALAWGLVDEVADEDNPTPPAFMNNLAKRPRTFLPRTTWRQKLAESTGLGRRLIYRGAEQVLRRKLPDDMPAPVHALDAVRIGLKKGIQAGLDCERASIAALAQTEASRNLVSLHLNRDRLRKEADRRSAAGRPSILGIVGGGGQAAALMHLAVAKGYQVIIQEAGETSLGFTLFGMLTMFQEEVVRGATAKADLVKNLANVRGTTSWKDFATLDLVLEAAGDEPAKRKTLFHELEKHTDARALLVMTSASTTVREIQQGLAYPERVAGLLFSAPVQRSLLVEVVASEITRPDLAATLKDFVVALGRMPWTVKDQPGFLIERILVPYFNEAILLLKEGLTPPIIDEAMVRFGMSSGPLEQLDLMGLDVASGLVASLAKVLAPRLELDGSFAFMVDRKWLGQKTNVGFYHYRGKKRHVNQPLISQLRAQSHTEAPHRMDTFPKGDQLKKARQRLVLLMTNEAAWCLEEKRAESPQALDLAMMLAGWAPHRGGPLHYAAHLGMESVIADLKELAAVHGPRYQPCPRLHRHETGK